MRQIKFRAWYENKMYEVYGLDSSGMVQITLMRFHFIQDVMPDAMMQFTGLLDKNGKEIYEGDIAQRVSKSAGIVKYHKERAAFIMQDGYNELLYLINPIEVIGNIYEHKHLLK